MGDVLLTGITFGVGYCEIVILTGFRILSGMTRYLVAGFLVWQSGCCLRPLMYWICGLHRNDASLLMSSSSSYNELHEQ